MSWRSRLRLLLQPPRRLRPTRLGGWFVVGVIAIGVAAVNTGNNLLYFVLGMFLAAIVVSGILSERNLRHMRLSRVTHGSATAGEDFPFFFGIARAPGRLPALALTIRERDPLSGVLGTPVNFPRVDAGTDRRRPAAASFPKRGVHQLQEVELATSYPFGLFRKSRRIELVTEVRVRPKVAAIDLDSVLGGSEEGVAASLVRGDGLDLFGLRDHAPGDDARRIHWKASARTGRIVVKDPAREEPPQVMVQLVLSGWPSEEVFERAVERAAGIAAALLREGVSPGLLAGAVMVPPSAQPGVMEQILEALVEVAPGEDAAASHEMPRGAGLLTVGPARAAAAPAKERAAG